MSGRRRVRSPAWSWLLAAALAGGVGGCSDDGSSGATATEPTGSTSPGTGGGGGAAAGGAGGAGGTATGGAGGAATGGGGGSTSSAGGGGAGGGCSAFVERLGGEGPADDDQLAAAVVTADGGAVIAGEMRGTMAIGATTLVSAGGSDALVVRFAPGGGVAWAKRFGSVYDDRVRAAAAMPDGGVVLVGVFDGAVDFGGTTLTSIAGPDAFVARLGSAGELVFALQFENADARAVAIDEGGDVLVAGDFTGTSTFGGIPLVSSQNDVFVARVSPAGAVLDAVQFASQVKPGALALGAGAGRTYLAGSFQGTLDFGGGAALVSAGSRDVFVARLDGALGAVLARRFGDDTSQEARAVAVLSDGSAAIAGAFRGSMVLDGVTLAADTQDDAFVARLGDDGAVVFARRFGDAAAQGARAVAAVGGDGIVVGGGFAGSIDVGDGPIASAGGEDAFLAWLDAAGAVVKVERWGGALDQRVRAVAADPCGAVVLGGELVGELAFGGVTLSAPGTDLFAARLAP